MCVFGECVCEVNLLIMKGVHSQRCVFHSFIFSLVDLMQKIDENNKLKKEHAKYQAHMLLDWRKHMAGDQLNTQSWLMLVFCFVFVSCFN